MRVATVSEMKRGGRTYGRRNDYPSESTWAWEILQELKPHKGHAVDLRIMAHSRRLDHFYSAMAQLTDTYGMDIRQVKKRSFQYVLAGEWFGTHYTDYCAQAFSEGLKE
jgi:hypothetical protein